MGPGTRPAASPWTGPAGEGPSVLLGGGPALGSGLLRVADVLTGHPPDELGGLTGARGARRVGRVAPAAAGRPAQRLRVVAADVVLTGPGIGVHGHPRSSRVLACGTARARATGRTPR